VNTFTTSTRLYQTVASTSSPDFAGRVLTILFSYQANPLLQIHGWDSQDPIFEGNTWLIHSRYRVPSLKV